MTERLAVDIEQLNSETIGHYIGGIVMHPEALERLIDAVDDRLLFLIAKRRATGEVVGQIGINPNSPTRDDTRAHIAYPTPAIAFMHVNNKVRKHGVGSELLQAACDVATGLGASSVYLTVAETNDIAKTFYSNHNFRDWGHGTITMPQAEQAPDGSWQEPTMSTMNVMIRSLTTHIDS